MLIRDPGVKNHNAGHYVSTVVITPTMLATTGPARGLRQHGRDLSLLIKERRSSWRDRVLLEGHYGVPHDLFGICVLGRTTSNNQYGDRDLYEMRIDPSRWSNVANDPALSRCV
jgi:hypothetical protein